MRRMIAAAALLAVLSACRGDEADRRVRLLRPPAAERLSGTWSVAFLADPHPILHETRDTVAGMLVFVPNDHGPLAVADLDGITHEGAYDLDFAPFGWTTRDADAPATAVARIVLARARTAQRAGDSLYVVLSPGTEHFSVRMAGILTGDSATGVWSASAHSAGGGEGRFLMARRRSER